MDQSSKTFRDVIERNCSDVKPQKGRLVQYLLERKIEPRAIELIAKHFVLNSVTISGVEISGEFWVLNDLQTEEGNNWVRKGYVPIGSCPNGDLVLLDIGEAFGSVRYVSHETFYDEELADSSIVVAASLGEFAHKLENQEIASCFFEERWRSRAVNPEKDEPGDAPNSPVDRDLES